VLLLAASAEAQFMAPIRYNEGPGVKISESLVFHPGIAIEGRYDTNVFRSPERPVGAPYLRVIGHLHLATLSPQRLEDEEGGPVSKPKVAFRLKGAAAYREYFPVGSNGPSVESRIRQQRAIEADAGFFLKLFPYGVFSAKLYNDYVRTYPFWQGEQLAGTTATPTSRDTARNTNRGGINFTLAPGGRRITFDLGYSINLDIFDEAVFNGANKLYHRIDFNAKWRLLPKTAIFIEVIQQFLNYFDSANVANRNRNSMPLRAYAGFAGLFTPRFSALAKIGYGNGFYEENDSFNGPLAHLELAFHIGPFAKIKAGYEYMFGDSFNPDTNFHVDNRFYLAYDHLFINRILLHLKGQYRWRNYGGFDPLVYGPDDALSFHIAQAHVALDYKIKSWIYIGIGYDLALRYRAATPSVPPTGSGTFASDFVKHQLYGKVGVSY
jgi:hypothetical protein